MHFSIFYYAKHLLNEALTHMVFTFNLVGKDTGCIRGPKVSPRDKDVFYFEVAILYMPPSDLGYVSTRSYFSDA